MPVVFALALVLCMLSGCLAGGGSEGDPEGAHDSDAIETTQAWREIQNHTVVLSGVGQPTAFTAPMVQENCVILALPAGGSPFSVVVDARADGPIEAAGELLLKARAYPQTTDPDAFHTEHRGPLPLRLEFSDMDDERDPSDSALYLVWVQPAFGGGAAAAAKIDLGFDVVLSTQERFEVDVGGRSCA